MQYCYQCEEYLCRRYDGIDEHDSLIFHRNQKKDIARAKEIGIEAYLAGQQEKKKILNNLLKRYNDGSRDVFFSLPTHNVLHLDPKMYMKEQIYFVT